MDGQDIGEQVRRAVRDRAEAWRFIGAFAASWYRPLTDGDGVDESELQEAEARLGLRFPAALREAYSLFGRCDDLTSGQDWLLYPRQLRVDDGGQVLVYRVENQNCAAWGVRLGDLGQADPPVVFNRLSGVRWEGWRPYLDRFSVACLEIILSESLFNGPGDNRELDDGAAQQLEQRFERLPLPPYPLWALPDGPPVRWFHSSEAVLRDDAESWLWVGGRTDEAVARVRDALPGEWLMTEP